MQSLQKILKLSAKKTFSALRDKKDLYCPSIGQTVQISRLFWNHVFFARDRKIEELIERQILLPLIPDILAYGTLVASDTRNQQLHFRITKSFYGRRATVIIVQSKNTFLLLSCFMNFSHKEKTLSWAIVPTQAQRLSGSSA